VVHSGAVAKKGRKGKAEQRGRAPSATPAVATAAEVPDLPSLASAAPSAVEPAPAGSRTWSNALIVLFLAFHVAMPLRYYLGGGGYDERFSWRMFSTLRMQKCSVKVEETVGSEDDSGAETRAVNLQKTVQIAWIGMLERYRRPVVDKLLRWRCGKQADARAVRYTRDCVDTDGSALPTTRVSIDCPSGRIDADEGAAAAANGATP
jgi:hypothetical protein